MRIEIMTLAELAGIACVLIGGYVLGNVGGAVLALGAVLLYEAKT